MTSERIKEIQQETPYPESVSVYQALLKVWNECEQSKTNINPSTELVNEFIAIGCLFANAEKCASIAVRHAEEYSQHVLAGLLLNIELDLYDAEFRPEDYHKYAGLEIAKLKIKQLLNK